MCRGDEDESYGGCERDDGVIRRCELCAREGRELMMAEGRSSSVVNSGWVVEPLGGEAKILSSFCWETGRGGALETEIRMSLEVFVEREGVGRVWMLGSPLLFVLPLCILCS